MGGNIQLPVDIIPCGIVVAQTFLSVSVYWTDKNVCATFSSAIAESSVESAKNNSPPANKLVASSVFISDLFVSRIMWTGRIGWLDGAAIVAFCSVLNLLSLPRLPFDKT